MIRQRINAGLARARAQGTQIGRPKIDARTGASIRDALANGTVGMLKIAAAFVLAAAPCNGSRLAADLDHDALHLDSVSRGYDRRCYARLCQRQQWPRHHIDQRTSDRQSDGADDRCDRRHGDFSGPHSLQR